MIQQHTRKSTSGCQRGTLCGRAFCGGNQYLQQPGGAVGVLGQGGGAVGLVKLAAGRGGALAVVHGAPTGGGGGGAVAGVQCLGAQVLAALWQRQPGISMNSTGEIGRRRGGLRRQIKGGVGVEAEGR